MLRCRNFILWLTLCCVSKCFGQLENEVEYKKGCYGNYIFDPVSNSCVPVTDANVTEPTTTTSTSGFQIPDRFNFVARLQNKFVEYNETEDNSTVTSSVEFDTLARDLVENATDILNVTDVLNVTDGFVHQADKFRVGSVGVQTFGVGYGGVRGVYVESFGRTVVEVVNSTDAFNVTEVPEVVQRTITEVGNSTEHGNSTVDIVARHSHDVEVLNTTEPLNVTESQVSVQRSVTEVENVTDCANSTVVGRIVEVENVTLNETVVGRTVRSVEEEVSAENVTHVLNETVARQIIEVVNTSEVLNVTQVPDVVQRSVPELVNSTEFDNSTIVARLVEIVEGDNVTLNETGGRFLRNVGSECSSVGLCVHGVCDKYSESFYCICSPVYYGQFCETPVERKLTYESVLNNTFCLDTFLNETFKNLTVAYDELIINLVDRIWSEINPEEHYVHIFDYKNLSNSSNVGQELQKLQYYSGVSLFNFEQRINLYGQVLDGLINYFENSTMKDQAVNFVTEWENSKNISQFQPVARHVITNVVDKVQKTLNETYYRFKSLIESYDDQLKAGKEITFNNLDSLINSTDKSWVDVVEYGFWHITSQLANKNELVYLNERPLQAGKRSLPQGIYKVFSRINSNYLFKYVLKPNLNGQTLAAVLRLFL